jgi:MFS family permease
LVVMSVVMFVGLPADPTKSWRDWTRSKLSGDVDPEAVGDDSEAQQGFFQLLRHGFSAAKQDATIRLAYAGGFVARAASVTNMLFIPLVVLSYYVEHGKCEPVDGEDIQACRPAYERSAQLTGISALVALLGAPIWGFAKDRVGDRICLILVSILGVVSSWAMVEVQDISQGFYPILIACFFGFCQIGGVTLSVAMCTEVKHAYSGAVAGVYTLCGVAGIALITRLGGYFSDRYLRAPFIVVGAFYGFLLAIAVVTRKQIAA